MKRLIGFCSAAGPDVISNGAAMEAAQFAADLAGVDVAVVKCYDQVFLADSLGANMFNESDHARVWAIRYPRVYAAGEGTVSV